jgi:hypothetical protein
MTRPRVRVEPRNQQARGEAALRVLDGLLQRQVDATHPVTAAEWAALRWAQAAVLRVNGDPAVRRLIGTVELSPWLRAMLEQQPTQGTESLRRGEG